MGWGADLSFLLELSALFFSPFLRTVFSFPSIIIHFCVFKKTAAAILRMHSILSHLPHKHAMKYFNVIVLLHTLALTTRTFCGQKERVASFSITPFMVGKLQNGASLLGCLGARLLHCFLR